MYGIPKVIIGENKTYMGAETLLIQKGVEIIVVNNNECIEMMENFIKTNPGLWNEDIGVLQTGLPTTLHYLNAGDRTSSHLLDFYCTFSKTVDL